MTQPTQPKDPPHPGAAPDPAGTPPNGIPEGADKVEPKGRPTSGPPQDRNNAQRRLKAIVSSYLTIASQEKVAPKSSSPGLSRGSTPRNHHQSPSGQDDFQTGLKNGRLIAEYHQAPAIDCSESPSN